MPPQPPPNPVLFYHPDGYRVARKDLKGRHSAGESFLAAFLDRAEGEVFGLCTDNAGAKDFGETVKAHKASLKPVAISRADIPVLRQQRLLNLPYPDLATEARLRNFTGDSAYALCGVTHTISSRAVLTAIADFPAAPVQPWDALICTSRAVQAALSTLLDAAEEHLRRRLGATTFTRPLMPVIPLGVHGKRFTRSETTRKQWRKKIGLADDAVAILFFGRLSVHAKAAPFQLAQAAEMAAKRQKRPIAILWCGRFSDDFQRNVFMKTAKAMAPSVAFHHVDGHDDAACAAVWSAADIFCSLSDNVQESFGLTVIEAMAAGLPVVASNWDGYREALQDGVNGILVDSYLPPSQLAEIAYRYFSGLDTYDLYVAALSQLCFVDLEQTAAALTRLAGDAALRKKLGAEAKKTIEAGFEWKVVMARYAELWREQSEILQRSREKAPSTTLWKSLDPAHVFASFPSKRLEAATKLAPGPQFASWDSIVGDPGIVTNAAVLTGRANYKALQALFSDGQGRSIGDLLAAFPETARPSVLRTLYWAIKVGFLTLAT